MIRKIVYSQAFAIINKAILSIFYDKKYLSGKFFDDQRYGFVWAWKGIPRRVITLNRGIDWPVSNRTRIPNGKNIEFDPSSINVFQSPGCYFQNHVGKIKIGKDVYIAPNVGIITANHDPLDLDFHLEAKDISIGDRCWIGMNVVILPGVKLGSGTIVGAGAVVTHSFVEGNCIVIGNPARLLKKLK